jgi:hypothetical protein
MLWADGSPNASSRTEPVQVTWVVKEDGASLRPPCVNPPGDLYYACFGQFDQNTSFRTGNTLEFSVPEDIVSRRPPTLEGQPRYGLIYAFFAVCAGQLVPAAPKQQGALPFTCETSAGVQLGPDDFVAGYVSLYVFERGFRNQVPAVMSGFDVAGKIVASDCIGIDCVGPDQPISFDATDPIDCATESTRCVASCSDDGDASCPEIDIRPLLNEGIAERDEVSANFYQRDLGEQMWINYYADRGGLKSEVRLLNDAGTGWNSDYGTTFYAPRAPGLVTLWSVVHDNRGGTNWVQTRLRVQEPAQKAE